MTDKLTLNTLDKRVRAIELQASIYKGVAVAACVIAIAIFGWLGIRQWNDITLIVNSHINGVLNDKENGVGAKVTAKIAKELAPENITPKIVAALKENKLASTELDKHIGMRFVKSLSHGPKANDKQSSSQDRPNSEMQFSFNDMTDTPNGVYLVVGSLVDVSAEDKFKTIEFILRNKSGKYKHSTIHSMSDIESGLTLKEDALHVHWKQVPHVNVSVYRLSGCDESE